MVNVILTRIDSLEENKVNLSGGEVSIGRGSILGCDDKRISRKHGLLQVSNDGRVTLVSMHSNPCFYKVQDLASYTVLVKGQSKILSPGDEFALLPDSYRYRIDSGNTGPNSTTPTETENAINDGENTPPSKRKRTLPGWLTSLSTDGGTGLAGIQKTATKQNTPAPSSATSSRKRKASIWNSVEENVEVQTSTKQDTPAPSSVSPSRKMKASTGAGVEENGEVEARINQEAPPVSESPTPSSTVEKNGETRVKEEALAVSGSPIPSSTIEENGETRVKKELVAATLSPSPPTAGGAESTKNGYEAEYGQAAGSSSRRDPCPYGAACYRKNPGHRAELSHPGDADYPVLPECPYGAACYRRNLQHRRDYRHAGPPASPPTPTPAAAASPTSNVNYYSCNVTYSVCPKCQNTTCIDLTKDDPEL